MASLNWSDKNGSDACAVPIIPKTSGVGSVHCTIEKQPYQHDEPFSIIVNAEEFGSEGVNVKLCMEDGRATLGRLGSLLTLSG